MKKVIRAVLILVALAAVFEVMQFNEIASARELPTTPAG